MGQLFTELKRRNVFRVGIAYGVVGWLVLQILDVVVGPLGLPDWTAPLVIVLLAVGFPVALLFAWAFELTPEGLKKTRNVDKEKSATATTARKLDFAIIAALLLGLGYLIWDKFANVPTDQAGDGAVHASIAVLPFVNMSADKDQVYFSDGISEEILNVLAQVPDLHVTSRSSAFRFRGNDIHIPTVARQLGVANILEGSVRRSGTRVRITAQLIDAKTDRHLWSATYERELTDIFAVQDEISAAIVAALSEAMGLALPAAPKVQQTANSAAYDAYLLGILEANRRSGTSLEAARRHLERALALDPDYAPAHARLAVTLGLLPLYNNSYTRAGIMERMGYHAGRAMVLAPDAPESLAAKGYYNWQNTRPLRGVAATFERVVALNPSYTDVLAWLGNLYEAFGDYQAQIDLYAGALKIDPLNPLTIANNVELLIDRGRLDEARALIDRLRTLSPSFYWDRRAILAWRQGLMADAAIEYLEQLAVDGASSTGRGALAYVLTFGLGLADEATGLDHRDLIVQLANGQIEEAMAEVEGLANWGLAPKGWVLLTAGRSGEATVYLNQAWDRALAVATVDWLRLDSLIQIGRGRQLTGDAAGGREALEAALAVVARQRAVGYNIFELDWQEGLARYFLGQKEAGLRLLAGAVNRGYAGFILQPQFAPLTGDPAFATILAAHDALAAAERKKFLALVCNGGNPAPAVWTPGPETCAAY
jgi:TolB-like protein